MRESRYVSLIPRITLHSDSEQLSRRHHPGAEIRTRQFHEAPGRCEDISDKSLSHDHKGIGHPYLYVCCISQLYCKQYEYVAVQYFK
jgi:hypothetical protein